MNNDEYLVKLYNSVFNNIYLKKIIFKYLNLYNILSINISFKTLEEWANFKYKEFLNKVTFEFDHPQLNTIPENIKNIIIQSPKNYVSSVPNHLDSVSIYGINIQGLYSLIEKSAGTTVYSKLQSLSISVGIAEQIRIYAIPDTITDLSIENYHKTLNLTKHLLPKSLKKLSINFIVSFSEGCFPESLTQISIYKSNPKLLNQLALLKSLVKVNYWNKDEKIDDSIRFSNSLQELHIECESFNTKLPDSLKTLELLLDTYTHEIQFPSSLENIIVEKKYDQLKTEIFSTRDKVPSNLKSLKLSLKTLLDNNGHTILPDNLERFIIYEFRLFNKELLPNQLPLSLTYLDLGPTFNQVINPNVLPTNLKTLILGDRYSKAINPLSIPQQLKLLKIENYTYNHPINLSPLTHPYTVVSLYQGINLYYKSSNTQQRVLKLPDYYEFPLSVLKLQNKSNLEYLNLGQKFNDPIQLSDLPTQNNIKTLEVGENYNQTINLEYFQNLETIIINRYTTSLKIITSIINNNNTIIYNNYKLKNIIISPVYSSILFKELNSNFYQFIKINNNSY